MIDQQLYSESACSLDDQLVGVQGYKLMTREHRTNVFGGVYTNVRKIRFDQAKCHEDKGYKMTDDHALLSPARTKGFSLSERTFAWFLVECISEVNFRKDSFDKLAMEPGPKNMVKALTRFHAADKNKFEDIVRGKGQGMVVSLEGPPGSGKTLTAGEYIVAPIFFWG